VSADGKRLLTSSTDKTLVRARASAPRPEAGEQRHADTQEDEGLQHEGDALEHGYEPRPRFTVYFGKAHTRIVLS
jgi:hypothetical protein